MGRYSKEYYLKNIKKIKVNNRRYYQTHKKEILKRAREYNSRNLDRFREIHKIRAREWRENNYKKWRKNIKDYYEKNKNKYISRIATSCYVYGKKRGDYTFKKIDGPKNECKECKTNKNLQIHHEIYPTRKKEIIQAIKDGYIYYLCKDCHSRSRRSKIVL